MDTTTRPHELIPTQELLAELFARYDTAIFAGLSEWVKEAGFAKIRVNWRGNLFTALAMTARLAHTINVTLDDRGADALEEDG